VIRLRGTKYKSYAEHFILPVIFARQYLGNTCRNMRSFLAREFQMKSGMKSLIEAFYRSITDDAPLPIPYREILLTTRIMDSIFAQIAARAQDGSHVDQVTESDSRLLSPITT